MGGTEKVLLDGMNHGTDIEYTVFHTLLDPLKNKSPPTLQRPLTYSPPLTQFPLYVRNTGTPEVLPSDSLVRTQEGGAGSSCP